MGAEVMLDPVCRNSLSVRNLGACASSLRPRLGATALEPEVVPVQVRVRLTRDEVLVIPQAMPHSGRSHEPLPVGVTLDCYV